MPACGPSTTFVKASYINAASAFLLTQRLTPGASPYIPLLPSSNHPVRPSWHQAFRPTGSCSLFVIGLSTSSSDAGLWSIDHLRQGLIHKCSQCFPAHVAVDTRGESIHRAGSARRLSSRCAGTPDPMRRRQTYLAGGAIIASRFALNGLSAYPAGHTPAWLRYWPSSYSAWVSSRMPA